MYLPSQDTKIYVVGKPAVHTIKIYTAVQEYFIHIFVNVNPGGGNIYISPKVVQMFVAAKPVETQTITIG
jgi:hypothetical protein